MDYMTTKETAEYLGCSTAWLEIGRSKNYGPPFIRMGVHSRSPIRYRREAVDAWMISREGASRDE